MKKKTRKPRATHASLALFQGVGDTYVLVTPYDKKGREIPTSVSCIYNADYFCADEIRQMVNAL